MEMPARLVGGSVERVKMGYMPMVRSSQRDLVAGLGWSVADLVHGQSCAWEEIKLAICPQRTACRS